MRRLLPVLASLLVLAPIAPGCGDSGKGTATESTTNGDSQSSTDDATGNESTGGDDGCDSGAPTDKTGENKMAEFGAPCSVDADCEPILGAGAKCIQNILDLYDAPGGYCTLDCELPDAMTKYELDNAACGAGIYCMGANGFFTACVPECTSDEDCWREGYECRLLPQLGAEGDRRPHPQALG